MRPIRVIMSVMVLLIITLASCRYVEDAQDTAYKEFKPSALLEKYEYYKDASAQLDKKVADIGVYNTRINELKIEYTGVARKDWARDDREQMSIWQSELAGVKASYNLLAADYNAAMAKFNYAFCNVGDMPKGAETPLPRSYKPYIDE
jgi:two-component SAPR family response regulator